jgi:hypothetical protein
MKNKDLKKINELLNSISKEKFEVIIKFELYQLNNKIIDKINSLSEFVTKMVIEFDPELLGENGSDLERKYLKENNSEYLELVGKNNSLYDLEYALDFSKVSLHNFRGIESNIDYSFLFENICDIC